jgi:ABC-2 type transport system ATP-binding protein
MHDMELLFLDEPTIGLDPSARRKLLDYLKRKVKEGLTIFFTTHVLTEAEYICDEIAIINKGKIIAVDSPDDLKNRFGRKKTIKIHLGQVNKKLSDLLSDVKDCQIDFNSGTNITINSDESELILLKVLQILNSNSIVIEDLSAMPTNLEEIFLKVVDESNESNN